MMQSVNVKLLQCLEQTQLLGLDPLSVWGQMGERSEDFFKALSDFGVSYKTIEGYEPSLEVLRLLKEDSARQLGVIPLGWNEGFLLVGVENPFDFDFLNDLQVLTGCMIEPVMASHDEIQAMIAKYYQSYGRSGHGTSAQAGWTLRTGRESPVVRLVHDVIYEAIHVGASDIHWEPFEDDFLIRYRQDGLLRIVRKLHARNAAEIISRIKVMASIDIAERRRPQDGRIRVMDGQRAVDLRVSVLPTEFGQKVVLRILDKGVSSLSLQSLGLDDARRHALETQSARPNGMILVTGPTGSGKSTTLYSVLNHINSPELNICTIEDPIEYQLDGIIQTNVKPEIDLTFSSALRTLLRQDPNVIMVGEMRDQETAELGIRASLTGHLVFSTLHTNDASSAITRLLDMGIEPFLLSSSLSLIVAQRLVRKNCPHCLQAYKPDPRVLDLLHLNSNEHDFQKGTGCLQCGQTGFRGRIGIFEMLVVDDSVRHLIQSQADAQSIRNQAVSTGMITLRNDGIQKAFAGQTTLEEVVRETAV